jgi:hypothetical protein
MRRYEVAPLRYDQLNNGDVDTLLPIGPDVTGAGRRAVSPVAIMMVRCSAGGALPRSIITFAL